MLLPEQILVRPARREDVDSIVAFSTAMALETEGRRLDLPRLCEGTLSLLSAPERGFFLVAEILEAGRHRLIGQLMITFEWSDWRNAAFWWVQSVYVAPTWRRQGVYRAMYDHIVAKAKADPQVCGIRLYVERDNRTAQTVYQHVGLAPSVYAVYEQDFILVRQISPSHDQQRDEAP
ncbi:MAG: GNAT family N-acetyltransferase [Nitrospirae bacterium]|nr:GNAT family N-acetyltransferase [Nitrospirota bacterium]